MQSATNAYVRCDGRARIMMGSNNYLGLADHPRVREAARKAIDDFGTASTGSRVLNGTIDLHVELEAELAAWHGTEDALVFTTGYQTNVGAIGALIGPGDAIVLDCAAHASIQDGAELSRAAVHRFAHNDTADLRTKLEASAGTGAPTLVAVDGLYSMEGDLAPMHDIAALCSEFGAMLMVDEAHSAGIFGEDRTGVVSMFDLADQVEIRMGTLSKGLASTGGYVAGRRDVIDVLRTGARAWLFTTSGVPAAVAAALEAVRIARSSEGAERAQKVLTNARYLRDGLAAQDISVGGESDTPWGQRIVSPIVPVRVGETFEAVSLWNQLYENGIYTGLAIHPAVPRNGALLRLCVTASHSKSELDRVIDTVVDVCTNADRSAA